VETEPKQAGISSSPSGALCLDFANTAEWHASEHPQERLTSYSELIAWAKRRGIVDEKEARAIDQEAAAQPRAAARALGRALELREALYRVFSRLAHGMSAEQADLELVNQALAASLAHARLRAAHNGFTWGWEDPRSSLESVLWPVMHSAGELLTSERLAHVGQCQDDRGCGWLFIDTSRNHTRRWCSMGDCGNRAKARRHHQRAQKTLVPARGKPSARAPG
jgi:predicted RNA-binding Zn ribbon-like protein